MSIFESVFTSLTTLISESDLFPLAIFSAVLGVLICGIINILKGL